MADFLQTPTSLMETPETPIIVAGGASSSALLNQLREGAITDLLELDRRTGETCTRVSLLGLLLATQLSSLSTAIQALSARLPETTDGWLADFFTEDFLHSTNTASVSSTYGQATLPLLSVQDKLVGQDTAGEVWVPKEATVHYAYQETAPTEAQWLSDPDSRAALDQQRGTAWWRDRGSAGYVWVRVRVPPNLNANKVANCLILHPFPILSWDLHEVEYRTPEGTWESLDLTYLEGWDGEKVAASGNGNLRLFFPQAYVVELRLKLYTGNLWGFTDIRLQHVQFSPAATLVVDFSSYSPGSLGTTTLYGKDQDALAYLQSSITGNRVTVALTQTTENSTPIITGVEVRA